MKIGRKRRVAEFQGIEGVHIAYSYWKQLIPVSAGAGAGGGGVSREDRAKAQEQIEKDKVLACGVNSGRPSVLCRETHGPLLGPPGGGAQIDRR
jgi:hypothetical protein